MGERERGKEGGRRREREGREDGERMCEIVRGDIGETCDHRLPLRCCVRFTARADLKTKVHIVVRLSQ